MFQYEESNMELWVLDAEDSMTKETAEFAITIPEQGFRRFCREPC